MADKRISQLVDRGTVANNDVVPIVVSGASTTNKATISSIQTFMQGNLDLGVTSVGLSMPSAFVVSASPVTSSGNISVTGAGTVAQYIRGDGSLADFPSGGGGGGASVSYYLNGSVSQGTIGGVAYREMNKVPILGAGTDITIAADGYIASFITDAGDPALLEIPAGNWNFESYFSASSGGGSPSFYIELYKVNSGGTATLIASNSATPELISFGTSISPYFSPLAVPTTVLTVTDRLAVRYYVTHSGRTITLHTENGHLCQIITTFTTGLTALNGLTAQVQNFATGTSGTNFGISSTGSTHTFNIPTASATNRGLLSTTDWSSFNGKVPYTGAVASVDLGVYSITANAINSAGSGSTAGQINLRSDAFFSLVNGYGSIASGTTNQFNLYQTTGAGVFRGAILSLNSITASATRTFTLPDASGTLALTTDLSGYLPLTGGTLTGPLNGTSAAFTGAISGSANTITATTGIAGDFTNNSTTNEALRAKNNGSGNIAAFRNSSSQVASISNSGGLTLSGALNGTSASFTGLATTPITCINDGQRQVGLFRTSLDGGFMTFQSSGANTRGFIGNGAGISSLGETSFGIRSESDLILMSGGNNVRLTLASTGAATFSSSVTSTGTGLNPSLRLTNTTASTGTDWHMYSLNNGNFGVYNNTSGFYSLQIASTGAATFSSPNNLITDGSDSNIEIRSTTAYNANIGGSLGFGGFFNTTASANFAVIAGKKENATINNLAGYLAFYTRGALTDPIERMRITSGGNVGIGTTDLTSTRLRIKSTTTGTSNFVLYTEDSSANILFWVRDDGLFNTGTKSASPYNNATTGRTMVIEASGGLGYLVSTRESKANIKSIPNVDFINQLNPVQFNYRKKDNETNEYTDELYENVNYGFIADEVESVNKELVFYNEDGTLAGVEYNNMIAILTKAIQEQQEQIDSLKNQIK